MNSRQRFLETMDFGKPDRPPYFEEGIRASVIKVWYRQGLKFKRGPAGIFSRDVFKEIAPNLDPLPELNEWPRNSAELDRLRERLNADDPRRLPKVWKTTAGRCRKNEQILFLRVHHGFFLSMGVYKWQRFAEVSRMLLEDPELVREVMNIEGAFAAQLADRILNETGIDAAIFSEPIGGNEGPLISEQMYRDFVLESYKPLLAVLRKHQVRTVIMRSYANIRILIPAMLEYGINCLWACETNSPAMDYNDIRREHGPKLRLIGGIDLNALRAGKEMIRRELCRVIPPLIASGGYIPLAGGRIREDISLENYVYYRRLLDELVSSKQEAARDSLEEPGN